MQHGRRNMSNTGQRHFYPDVDGACDCLNEGRSIESQTKAKVKKVLSRLRHTPHNTCGKIKIVGRGNVRTFVCLFFLMNGGLSDVLKGSRTSPQDNVDQISTVPEEPSALAIPVRPSSLLSYTPPAKEQRLLRASLGTAACSALGFGVLLISPLALLFLLGRGDSAFLNTEFAPLYVGLPLIVGGGVCGVGCAGLTCLLNWRAKECADAQEGKNPHVRTDLCETVPLREAPSIV